MRNNAALLSRALLLAVPIAVYGGFAFGGGVGAFPFLVVGIIVLVARRRSRPEALVGSRGGRWWVWSLVGLGMVGASIIISMLSRDELGELGWVLFSLLFVAGLLIVAASIVRALALFFTRPSTPPIR